MGLFEGILSKILPKPTVSIKETIFLGNLFEWYELKQEPKKQKIEHEIHKIQQNIPFIITSAKQKLEELQKASPPNPNITPREIHFLQGNREAYTKKLNSFLEELNLPETAEELPGFLIDFKVRMQELAQGIARPMQILNEFLSHETRETTLPLGQIEKEIQMLDNKFQKLKFGDIEKTKDKIIEIQNKTQQQKQQVQDINETIQEINTLRQQNKDLAQEITLLQNDKQLNASKQQKQELSNKISLMKKEILESFSAIEPAIKKYAHQAYKYKELATKYLESPVEALLQDFPLEIIDMLAEIKRQTEHNTIEMKDKKIKKVLREIENITKEQLGSFLRSYGNLHKEEREAQNKLNRMEIFLVLAEKEKRKQKNDSRLSELSVKRDQMKAELGKMEIYLDEIKSQLCEEIKNQSGITLIISEEPQDQEETCPEQTQ